MVFMPKAAQSFVLATLFLDVLCLGMVLPVLPGLLSQITGCTLSEASVYGGWLMFAFSLTQFLLAPTMGKLSDRFGRRAILLLSLAGIGTDYLFMSFTSGIGWLFIGRLLAGTTNTTFYMATAYTADITSMADRAKRFGLLGAAFGLGITVGPVLGGELSQVGLRVPFYAALGITLLNLVYTAFVVPESLPVHKRSAFSWSRANPLGTWLHLRKYPLVVGLCCSLCCTYIAVHVFHNVWAYFTALKFNWAENHIGYSFGLLGLLIAFVQGWLTGFVAPKLGLKKTAYIGVGLYSLGYLLLALATDSWMLFAFLLPYAMGGISEPAIQSILSSEVPETEQGELQGGIASLASATALIGAPMMSYLFAFFTSGSAPVYLPEAPFLAAIALTLTSLFILLRVLHRHSLKSDKERTHVAATI
ncbi:TCR/Tet family MFS transporter [Pontibacter qinzhouensis]|uniref:TCR/Tet family MFS transporter n=1 Tax=Pontibacter qinzhouensis TaxID=2603253 RepID=A0A5C8K8I4_9BACT|nr:TCR/Tet family MFS transporter [Pontibacter qinzhouensis]TXK49836.1 TCR/Tet family MFS transporter [Pontibacter qinzhouensis]